MPRLKNETKYAYARTLLESGWSIRKVQDELKRIFGSGISPNVLSSMGKKFPQVEEQQNAPHEKSVHELSAADLSQIAEQFTSTTNKFSEQMEAQNILIKGLVTGMQTIQEHLSPSSEHSFPDVESTESYEISPPSEDQIEFQLSSWENHILKILTPRQQNISQILEKLGILRELTIRCLNHLEMGNEIESFEKNGLKIYRRINQAKEIQS
ncbi:MAG: hypothetical protein ACTSYI_02140 [Promethearchaeota archaeon]